MLIPSQRRSDTQPSNFLVPIPIAWQAVGVGVGIVLLCFAGIWSRPGGDLASVWPANAFLLGLLVRFVHLRQPVVWVAAALGYFAADALTGSPVVKNLLLNLSNLLAVAVGLWVARRFDASLLRLHTPMSVLYMVLVVLAASGAAGLTGLFTNPYLFNDSALKGFTSWFATEMANYIAFVPVILALPDHLTQTPVQWLRTRGQARKLLPLVALLLSLAAGL